MQSEAEETKLQPVPVPVEEEKGAPVENSEVEEMKDEPSNSNGEPVGSQEDNPEEKEGQEVISKKYTKQETYIMLSLVLRYPSGGHGGEAFWNWMTKIYGETLLEGRNGTGLRNRWRKMAKQYGTKLEEEKKKLEEALPKELMEEVESKIAEAQTNAERLGLSSKAFRSLFPELPQPASAKETERALKKKKLEDGYAEGVSPEESKKTKKPKDPLHKAKNYIDLGLLVSKKPVVLSTLLEDNLLESQGKIALSKNVVIIKDIRENTVALKDIKELPSLEPINSCKKLDSNLLHFFKTWNESIAENDKGRREWGELEDVILRHPENADLMSVLAKTHGEEEVAKRKKALNLL